MKVTVAYTPDEWETAANAVAVLRQLYPDIKVRKSERHPPFKHIYLTTKKLENLCGSKGRA